MALVAPAALVAAPARTALPFGLGSVLAWRTGDRFVSSVEWDSITCDPAGGRGGPDCDPAEVVGLPKVFDAERTYGLATPFVVYGHDKCSLIGNSFEDAQGYATNHLLAREEARAEQALWTGDLGNVPNFSGANGYPPPVSSGVHDTAADALAAVLLGIAVEYGSLGVVHMSWRTAGLLDKHLEARSGRLYTRSLGVPVVVGAGYPDVPLIVGTGAMLGYRGEVLTASNRPGDLFDRAQNDLYAVAEREYVVGFDPCPVVTAGYTGGTTSPGTQASLVMLLGSIPSSPIPDGTDTTIVVQTNIAPASEVYLHYAVNGGAPVVAGEMTQTEPTEFVWNVQGDDTGPGDSVEVWAVSDSIQSNHITIEVT